MTTPGRGHLTDNQWLEMFEAQGRKCNTCPETRGPFIAEHSNPNYYKPGKPDQLICKACDKEKFPVDMANISRTKRLNGESSSQASRRAERKAQGKPPLLRGPGFPSKKKRARSADEILGAR